MLGSPIRGLQVAAVINENQEIGRSTKEQSTNY